MRLSLLTKFKSIVINYFERRTEVGEERRQEMAWELGWGNLKGVCSNLTTQFLVICPSNGCNGRTCNVCYKNETFKFVKSHLKWSTIK